MIEDEDMKIFFKHHYRIVREKTLNPIIVNGKLSFQEYTYVEKRDMSLYDKIKYYCVDFISYLKRRYRRWRST